MGFGFQILHPSPKLYHLDNLLGWCMVNGLVPRILFMDITILAQIFKDCNTVLNFFILIDPKRLQNIRISYYILTFCRNII